MELHLLKFPWLSELSGNELSLCLAKRMCFPSCVNHRLLPAFARYLQSPCPSPPAPSRADSPPPPLPCLQEKMCTFQEAEAAHSVPVLIPLAKIKLG